MILSRASLTTPAALRGSLLLRPISRPMSSPSTSTEMSISESKAADKESMMGKAQDWLASPEGGARFKSCETPALYVSESAAPFPTNPAFIPPHPLSQSTKEAVYALYKAHPETWTPRKLAVHFGMSIARSTAILRLKSLEEQLKASGKAPQTDLSQGMEKMLRPLTLIPGRNVRPYEPERSDYAESMTPYFRFANETETFTPEDAATLMHKDPWSNMEKTLNVKAERVFTPGTPADDPKNLKTKEKIIKTDDKKEHLSRFDFMFVDSSKDKRDPDAVLVRDKKGTLRQASVLEKWYKKRGPQEKYVLG